MDEATANFFTTHATPLLSNRVPQGTQAQPDGGAGAHVTVVGPSNNDSTPQGDQAYSSNMGSAGSACAQLNITSFIPAPPSLQPTNPQQNIADFATACNDWSPSNGGAAAIAASLAPSQSMPPPQDASILAPQFCGFSPQATGCGQFSSYPEWYEPQNTNDDGIYLQTQGCYAPHGLYTDDPTTSPLSDFNSRRRATIDSSFLQQPDGMPIYSPNVIDPEPTSASGYFAMPQYAEATLHESPPGALLYLQHYGLPGEHQAAELPRGEKKSGTDKMKRKRGRPPTRIDTIEARRTPPNEWTGGSPVSTSTVLSTRSEPIPDSGAPTKTCNSRSTTLQARNRAAANRYRAKTQAAVAQLEAEEREVTMRRQSLLMCAGELLDQVFQLKNEVFRHANCGCPRIEGYLENAAQQAYSKQGVLTPSLSSAGSSSSSRSPSQKTD